jgi:ribosomal-protein-serine acetyltransferase
MREAIQGKRISLKRPSFNIETAKIIYATIDKCRDVFLPWLGWVKTTNSTNDTLNFLEMVENDWNKNCQFVYEIYVGEIFVGLISIINVSWSHKRAEIGYWLDTDYTGNGYISEALALIEKELFDNNFNRIVIHTDVLNLRSANVAIKAGYKHEGILRQNIYSEPNQRYRDQNVFSKLRSDIMIS